MRKRRDYRRYGKRKTLGRRFSFVGLYIVLLFVVYLVITGFLLRSFAVGSPSMTPTLELNERLLVTPLAYGPMVPFTNRKFAKVVSPKRGDIVIVRPPSFRSGTMGNLLSPIVSFFTANNVRIESTVDLPYERSTLIRRIVGIPGDTVVVRDFAAYIRTQEGGTFVNELELARRGYEISYDPLPEGWDSDLPLSGNSAEITLGPGEYFVLSDHRSFTSDSRYWGPVQSGALLGKVLFRYWPIKRIGVP